MLSTRRPYLVEPPDKGDNVEWFDTEDQAAFYAAATGGLVFRYDSEKQLYIHDKGDWYVFIGNR
jgi:hypothetical protein